jgi:hypothetical protein
MAEAANFPRTDEERTQARHDRFVDKIDETLKQQQKAKRKIQRRTWARNAVIIGTGVIAGLAGYKLTDTVINANAISEIANRTAITETENNQEKSLVTPETFIPGVTKINIKNVRIRKEPYVFEAEGKTNQIPLSEIESFNGVEYDGESQTLTVLNLETGIGTNDNNGEWIKGFSLVLKNGEKCIGYINYDQNKGKNIVPESDGVGFVNGGSGLIPGKEAIIPSTEMNQVLSFSMDQILPSAQINN